LFAAREREGGERFASGIKNVIDLANGGAALSCGDGFVSLRRERGGLSEVKGVNWSTAPSQPTSNTTPRGFESDAAPTPRLKRANFWLLGGL
jgi:hypothetical protein